MRSALRSLLFCGLLSLLFPAAAQSQEDAILLVAHPAFRDLEYRQTVLLAAPAPNGGHVGVILNRPTKRKTEKGEPLWFGGPVMREVTVALFRSERVPAASAFPVLKGVYLSMHPANLEALAPGQRYRFYSGFSGWAPGQLQSELARNSWYMLPPRDEFLFRNDMSGLWRELVEKARGGRAEPQIKPDILS